MGRLTLMMCTTVVLGLVMVGCVFEPPPAAPPPGEPGSEEGVSVGPPLYPKTCNNVERADTAQHWALSRVNPQSQCVIDNEVVYANTLQEAIQCVQARTPSDQLVVDSRTLCDYVFQAQDGRCFQVTALMGGGLECASVSCPACSLTDITSQVVTSISPGTSCRAAAYNQAAYENLCTR